MPTTLQKNVSVVIAIVLNVLVRPLNSARRACQQDSSTMENASLVVRRNGLETTKTKSAKNVT